ncbi:hypothetical protein ABE425_04640 [Chryseobacterium cucumeris]|uniref:hypothetical protein n=1 Tax=Chryseobacterium cucumeris TaxID=1813611 RepID=UPI00320A02F8
MEIKKGEKYKGIGYSGMTDGVEVIGLLHYYKKEHNDAIIICEKTGIHCAVIFKSLKKLS